MVAVVGIEYVFVFDACCDGHVWAVVVDVGHVQCMLVDGRRDDVSEYLQISQVDTP